MVAPMRALQSLPRYMVPHGLWTVALLATCQRPPTADQRRSTSTRRSALAVRRDHVRAPRQPRRRLHDELGVRAEHRLRRRVGSEVRDRRRRRDLRDDLHRPAGQPRRRLQLHDRDAELAPGAPNRIAEIWIDALDVGPTGMVWVGTAESGQPNDVYLSSDNGVTFTSLGLMSSTICWKSVKTAPTNMARAYISGYEIATADRARPMRTDNIGGSWTPSPLANVSTARRRSCSSPRSIRANADIVYMISHGANNSVGDRLYRSSDARHDVDRRARRRPGRSRTS